MIDICETISKIAPPVVNLNLCFVKISIVSVIIKLYQILSNVTKAFRYGLGTILYLDHLCYRQTYHKNGNYKAV